MRVEYVDERDSTWERYESRFRILRFEGPGNAVTAVDIIDATVEDAMEHARALSGNDQHLWSLALIEQVEGARGLVWLSGMDYNDTPLDERQWKLRQQMQNRYLLAREKRKLETVLPNGQRLLRVFPEWASGWPIWENFTSGYRLDASALDISPELGDALFDWNEEWLTRQENEPLADPNGWRERGVTLVDRLARELDGKAEIRPEFLWSAVD